MIKFSFGFVILMISSTHCFAVTLAEQQLLASWGVEQKESGIIEYKMKQNVKSTYWLTNPLPAATHIDYSRIPFYLKPLVIYNNY